MTTLLEPLRRIAAYAVCADSRGRVLLVRASERSGTPGTWSLPGGAVDHGEDPNHTVVRETAAETGLSVAVSGLADVLADMRALPDRGITIHTDRLIYRVAVRGGTLADRVGERPTDLARWYTLDEARELPPALVHRTRPRAARLLGRRGARRGTRVPLLLRGARPGRAAPGAALRRVRRLHRPGRPGAAHPGLRRLPRRRLLAPARRRHRLRRAARSGPHPRAGRGDRPDRPPGRASRSGQPPRRRLTRPRGLPDRLARGARLLPRRRRPTQPADRGRRGRLHLRGPLVRRARSWAPSPPTTSPR